jgi:hypothetical protein
MLAVSFHPKLLPSRHFGLSSKTNIAVYNNKERESFVYIDVFLFRKTSVCNTVCHELRFRKATCIFLLPNACRQNGISVSSTL